MQLAGDVVAAQPAKQAFRILHFAFFAIPIIAGIDKFLHLLADWNMYLAPWVVNVSPIPIRNLMEAIGVAEMIAGLIVAIKPRVGAWIVIAWLWAIILNLVTYPGYYDIAFRDFGLSLGALALARLSADFE
jgi:hypothetical protein